MKTGRPDLDAMLQVASIPANEPTFLLRAQDACAADTVRAWAALQLVAGAPPAVIEQALQQADAMEAWPVKKIPDAKHLTEAEAKNLAYDLSRRTWTNAVEAARRDVLDAFKAPPRIGRGTRPA